MSKQANVPIHPIGGGGAISIGLTKRELFAAMAMQGWCSNPEVRWNAEYRAKAAIESADALLAELEKGKDAK